MSSKVPQPQSAWPATGLTASPGSGPPPATGAGRRRLQFDIFRQLKHRNIFRVGLLYLAACWLILNPVHVVFDILAHPAWNRIVLVLMAIGFPVALLLAWVFEITPEGIRPTVLVDPSKSIRSLSGRKLDRALIVVLTLALAYMVADKYWPGASGIAVPQEVGTPGPKPAQTPQAATAKAPAAALARTPSPAPVSALVSAVAPSVPIAPPAPDPGAGPAVGEAVVTILDGQAQFIRGATRYRAAEGVRIEAGDIFATAADALVQLEFEDGTRVLAGPRTQWMMLSREAPPSRPAAYLLTGWIKVVAGSGPDAKRAFDVLRSAGLELGIAGSVTVTHVSSGEADVFVESGKVRLSERAHGSSTGTLSLAAGQFYLRKARQAGEVLARPSPEFIAQVPAGFRDALPPRFDSLRGRAARPQPAADFSYADVEVWLKSEGPIRRQLAERWKDKARDPAFRRSLEANLSDLPEWSAILFPPDAQPDGAAPADHPVASPAAP